MREIMNIEVNMNINEFVECELTEHGIKEIAKYGFKPEFSSGNFIRIQLWELMFNLGESIFNGSDQSIVGNRITMVAKTSA